MKSKLKEYRERGGWKLGEFAAYMGVSISHLSLIENNKRTPSLEVALAISEAVEAHVDDIWSN